MTGSIECSNCGARLLVPATAIGKTGRCNNCNTKFTIAFPADEATAPDPKSVTDDFNFEDLLKIDSNTQARPGGLAGPPELALGDTRASSRVPTPTSTVAEVNPRSDRVAVTATQGAIIIVLMTIGFVWQVFRPAVYSAKWEYLIASPDDPSIERELQKLGGEGWELVTARRATSASDSPAYEMIFKRQKR